MIDLDNIIHKKLQLLKENDKDLNPFFVSKEKVINLLMQKNSEHQHPVERLKLLSQLFSLTEQEQEIILVILAPIVDIKYQKIYAYLQDDLNKKEATIFLLSLLLSNKNEETSSIHAYLQTSSTLIAFQIIEIDATEKSLKISESIQNFLLGYYTLDPKITAYATIVTHIESQAYNFEHIQKNITTISKGLREQKRFILHIQGKDRTHKESIALHIAHAVEYHLLKVNLSALLEYGENLHEAINLLFRESILSGSLLYFDNYDVFSQDSKFHLYQQLFINKLNNFSSLSFMASTQKITPLPLSKEQLWYEISLAIPTLSERSLYWKSALQRIGVDLTSDKCDRLSNLFNFTLEQVATTVQQLKTQLFFKTPFNDALLYKLCRENISSSLKSLAQPLNSNNTFDDIILPKEKKELLIEVTQHYHYQLKIFETWGFKKHYQSQGIGVLLTGASGTGKTMAAAILANELELDLYRIELSRIVSKYIGETEKNLSKIFETAKGSGVILFFDEADAIFGKRTETKDSHDRYANIEVGNFHIILSNYKEKSKHNYQIYQRNPYYFDKNDKLWS